jgi:sigma-B regulation protein RsbU (phosphoserine phosphatase)
VKVRWKLLILLLGTAVVPTVAVSWADHLAIRHFGRDLADDSRRRLVDAAEIELRRTIESYATLIDREARLIEMILRRQADRVQQLLATEAGSAPRGVYLADDFMDSDDPPPGVAPSQRHARRRPDGTADPLNVSFDVPVIRLAPGLDEADVTDDVARLADAALVYRELRDVYPEAILWQYTSLESGVHCSYPGKGGYPPDYDPRNREWFTYTKLLNQLEWFVPVADVTTGQTVFTAAMPSTALMVRLRASRRSTFRWTSCSRRHGC